MLSWKGWLLRYSTSAYCEMAHYDISPAEVLQVLEDGIEATGRSQGVVEKCLQKKTGLVKVVACESHDYSLKEEVWVIIHVAVIKAPKKR